MRKPQIDIVKASEVAFAKHLDWLCRNQSVDDVANAIRVRARARGLNRHPQLLLDEMMAAEQPHTPISH